MKCEKGITLTALAIYVIVFLFIIGIVSTITSYFYNNFINFDETTKSYAEINKFNMFFLQDIKKKEVAINNIIETDGKKNGIELYDSNKYETITYNFKNNSIYRNGILICKNIEDMQFSIEENIISVFIQTQGTAGYTKTINYSMP